MKIGVCVKQVPATDSRIQIQNAEAGVNTADVKWEINPYDEIAIELALQMKEAGQGTEVVVFTIGDKGAEAKVREALARGADRAVRLEDAAFDGSDSLGTARILAAAVQKEEIGIVLTGKQAVDNDNGMVPAMMAEVLGWAHVQSVDQFEFAGDSVNCRRPAGGGKTMHLRAKLPAVIGCEKGLNVPRYASLKGIMMAKRKKIEVLDAAGLGLDPATVGAAGSSISVGGWSLPPARPSGRILEGSTAEVVDELVGLLRNEAKVI